MATNSFLGKAVLELGPAQIEIKPLVIDWDDPSGWINVGNTQNAIFRRIATKADLVSSQTGTEADNRVITGQRVEMESPLGQATLERLVEVVQDLKLEKTGEVVNQWMIVNKLGESDRDILFWIKITKIVGGIPSTDELDICYMAVAPQSETVEINFDANTQRFFLVVFRGYLNDSNTSNFPVQHSDGEFAFAWSKSNV